MAFFGRAAPEDDALLVEPEQWKWSLARVTLAHKAPGEPFLARDIARLVLKRWGHRPGREGRKRAALAVLGFLESLAEEGQLVRLESSPDGPLRFCKPPAPS